MTNWFQTVLILLAAFTAVFVSATFNGLRVMVGAQFDLLPSLMVYTAMSHGLFSVTLVAIGGGLLFDSLSANPLGISVIVWNRNHGMTGMATYASRHRAWATKVKTCHMGGAGLTIQCALVRGAKKWNWLGRVI